MNNDNETSMIKKIGSFIVKKRIVLICLVLMVCNVINFVLPRFYGNKTKNQYKSESLVAIEKNESEFVIEEIGLLDKQEYNILAEQAQSIHSTSEVAVYTIVAEGKIDSEKDMKNYAFDFTKFFHENNSISDNTILLFSVVEDDRIWFDITAFGKITESKITSSNINAIKEQINTELLAKNYYKAFNVYYDWANIYITSDIYNGQTNSNQTRASSQRQIENTFVFDQAGILEQENYNNIEEQAQSIYNTHGIGVYTVIVPEMAEKNEERLDDYVWSFATQFTNKVSISADTVLLFICVEEGNRWREALAFGPVHKKITNSRLRTIQDSITPALSKGSYYNAIKVYYNMANGYIMGKKPFNYIGHGIILLVSLLITTAVVVYLVKTAGGKMTVNHRTYSSNSAQVLQRHDQYLHTTTTRRTISRSSGGGGGGSSRGGGGRF